MTHKFLAISKALGKQSLSCGDITTLTKHEEAQTTSCSTPDSGARNCGTFLRSRFLRPKSALLHAVDLRRCSSPLDDIDRRLTEIKDKLSMFREQDLEFRGRLHSLSNSIDELAPRSSLSLSEASTPSDEANEEEIWEDEDQRIENKIKDVSMSLSSEVLNCIPVIEVTSYKEQQSSDPAFHTGTHNPTNITTAKTCRATNFFNQSNLITLPGALATCTTV